METKAYLSVTISAPINNSNHNIPCAIIYINMATSIESQQNNLFLSSFAYIERIHLVSNVLMMIFTRYTIR